MEKEFEKMTSIIESRTPIPLKDVAPVLGELGTVHREIVVNVADLAQALGDCIESATIVLDPTEFHLLKIVPKRRDAATVSIYLYHLSPSGQDSYIGLAAGERAYVNFPDDVFPPIDAPPAKFVLSAVRAIVDGKLVETTHFRGNRPYKDAFHLHTQLGTIASEHLRPCTWMRKCFSKHTEQVRTYVPYAAE